MQLYEWLEQALQGERQIVFVTGEAGIGKTTAVETFLTRAAADGKLWTTRGQCVEHYGIGEAYLPMLEALGALCRQPPQQRLITLLHQYAPMWLLQMPWLLRDRDAEMLQHRVQSATQARMLREMAEVLETLTVETPLVLVLEDLQWADYSTLDLLAFLAQRREPARLLLIGTARLAELSANGHPLQTVKQALRMRGHCQELSLGPLTEAAVAEYVTARVAGRTPQAVSVQSLARIIYQRSDGNPFFMVNIVEDLMAQGVMWKGAEGWELRGRFIEIASGVPDNLRQLIEQQFNRLSPADQRLLETASVAGVEFSATAVAVGCETEGVQIEERCEELTRQEQFLQSQGAGEWPDGTVTTRYRFRHALYQNILYERVSAGRRVQLHRRIGERHEQGYGAQAGEIAAELAVHFERGRDYWRAVHYLHQAAENATRRYAYREAINLRTRGLELLRGLPDTPERAAQEVVLQTELGLALQFLSGAAAVEAERAYTRALALCRRVGTDAQLFRVLQGLQGWHHVRGELQTARGLAEQCLSIAQRSQNPEFLIGAHFALGETLALLGEVVQARAHLEQALTCPEVQTPLSLRVPSLLWLAVALSSLGYPDQAWRRTQEALTLAQQQAHPFILAFALFFAARLCLTRREWRAAQEQAEAAISLSAEQGFQLWLAQAMVVRGRALTYQGQGEEGIAQIHQGLVAYRATGAVAAWPNFLLLLAGAYGRIGQSKKGLAVAAEALTAARKMGQCLFEASLLWLTGEFTLLSGSNGGELGAQREAEECFHQALQITRQHRAKSLELRAVMSLARLWQQQGKTAEARQMLAEIYGWFTEGFDTTALKDARALLVELSR